MQAGRSEKTISVYNRMTTFHVGFYNPTVRSAFPYNYDSLVVLCMRNLFKGEVKNISPNNQVLCSFLKRVVEVWTG